MKKTKFLALVLASVALAAMLSLAACGGQQQSSDQKPAEEAAPAATEQAAEPAAEQAAGNVNLDYVGTWEFSYVVDAQGNQVAIEDYAEANGLDAEQIAVSYELAADGSGVGTLGGVSAPVTWSAEGNVITITGGTGVSSDLTVGALDDGTLIMGAQDPNTGITSVMVKTA